MIPLDYALLRVGRRLLPERLVGWLRARRILLVPGLETREPDQAVARYMEWLNAYDFDITQKRIMVLGYGGSFGVAIALLQRGAGHVTLVDPYAVPTRHANEAYLDDAPQYVTEVDGRIEPVPEWITVHRAEVCRLAAAEAADRYDLVLSSSVLEHVQDVERLLECLRTLTADGGAGLHIIDLRDHYFKHPFEMLCHSDKVWRRVLEPPTRLNRLRLWQYRQAFEANFGRVEVGILGTDPAALARVRDRIRPQFLSGDEQKDAATKIALYAAA